MAKKAMTKKATTDYLAVIFIAGGSSYGRSPNKETAIQTAIRIYRADWGKLFKISKGDQVVLNIVNVAPHNDVWWDNHGVYADDEKKIVKEIERVERTI